MEINEIKQGVKMARPVRFERTTTGFVVRRSILNHCFKSFFSVSKSAKNYANSHLRVLARITATACKSLLIFAICQNVHALECSKHEIYPRAEFIDKSLDVCKAEAERFHLCVKRKCYTEKHFSEDQYCKSVSFLGEMWQVYDFCNTRHPVNWENL